MQPSQFRPRLHLLAPLESAPAMAWFCTACGGRQPAVVYAGSPTGPDCVHCGASPVREAEVSVAPPVDSSFLILDATARIVTISERAESLLDVASDDVRDRPVGDVLLDADAEGGVDTLRAVAVAIVSGQADAHRLMVRPAKVFGLRLPARLGICRPPRAALLVLGPSE